MSLGRGIRTRRTKFPPCSVSSVTWHGTLTSVQFSRSVMSNSLRPCESSTLGLPVHHQLLEFTQTHVHQVGDIIQPFHPLSSPFPPASNPSQHQGLFQWVSSLSVVYLFPYKFPVLPKPRIVNTGQVCVLWSEWMSKSTPLWMWPSLPSSSLPWNFGFLLQNETLD